MDPVIRAAVIDGERRRLVRRQNQPSAAVRDEGMSTATAANADPFAGQEEALARLKRELEAEREQLRSSAAAAQSQALREAAERGYRDGVTKAAEEGRARFDLEIGRVRALAEDLHRVRQDVLDDAHDRLVEIAFAAICRLAGSASARREVAMHAVRGAVAELASNDALRIAVHPDDVEWIAEQLKPCANVEVAVGPTVAFGGCMIDSTRGTLDARLETQLDKLRLALIDARRTHLDGAGQ